MILIFTIFLDKDFYSCYIIKMLKKLMVVCFAVSLAACNTTLDPRRGLAPQPQALIAQSERVGATASSSVLIRIFKQSKELELWRKTNDGSYALVKTYEICAYSGELGPKIKQGDRQAPEGFYTVGASQLNYHSIRYLSMNTGYPNVYDRIHGYTGAALMIHGGCDSAGCYAIEDQPMQEVFTAIRDAIKAGQKSVQVQIYPFRMNTLNMFFSKENKNTNFWQQLKMGYDKFEATHKEINVSVVGGKYVVN
jgi:murein L,D-transpeptidase YafK